MKIASWNVNSIKARFNHIQEFIKEHNPDILLLQETKCTNENFPHQDFESLPYNIYVHGQKSYNGVAIFSKYRADEVITDFPENPCSSDARFIKIKFFSPIGFLNVISVYVPNGGEVGSEKFELKLKFYDSLIAYLKSIQSFDEKLIIGGDFNVAPFNIDVYSPKILEQTTCFTTIEKNKLRNLINVGFSDIYRLLHPNKKEFSWWDYRAGCFEQNKGMRIDMIFSSFNATNDFSHCVIDFSQRAKHTPSDHVPVVIY